MNIPVKFELAKLLKEKGFDNVTNLIYMTNHTTEVLFDNINQLRHSDGNNPFCSAPTIAEVIMWLYEKHGIWISINPRSKTKWKFDIYTDTVTENTNIQLAESNSPTEAYEAAIEYCLTKLV